MGIEELRNLQPEVEEVADEDVEILSPRDQAQDSVGPSVEYHGVIEETPVGDHHTLEVHGFTIKAGGLSTALLGALRSAHDEQGIKQLTKGG